MGIHVSTLYKWKKHHSEISEPIKRGKEVSDYIIQNALFESAKNGNVTAQIFWLKNRKPDKWTDRKEIASVFDPKEINDFNESLLSHFVENRNIEDFI